MRRFLVITAIVIWVPACGASSGSMDLAPDSGITGVAVIEPGCPVEHAGSPCPPRPFVGTVRIEGADGSQTQVDTTRDGRFRVLVEPGSYELTPLIPDAGPPIAKSVLVTVRDGRFAEVTLTLDSGIR